MLFAAVLFGGRRRFSSRITGYPETTSRSGFFESQLDWFWDQEAAAIRGERRRLDIQQSEVKSSKVNLERVR